MSRKVVWVAAVGSSISMGLCVPTASGQETSPTTPSTTAFPTIGYYDDAGNWIPPSRAKAPDTDACPQKTWPPEPVSTSERVAETLEPLPATYDGPCGVSAAPGYVVPEKVVASAWLVTDIDSGEVVAMKDPHGRYRPASIVKVLLALVVIDELDLRAQVPVSEESAGQEGSAAGIGAGGEYTVEDLLHGLLLNSGNDCAHALAQALGGDEITLYKVNALAKSLGMTDTRATSYSGLDSAGMSTSAWDMSLAYRAAFDNATFARIAGTEHYLFPGFGDLPPFELWNDNHLFLYDPDGIGGKTGYTDDANHTFVGAVRHDGRRLLAVILDTAAYDARPWEQAQMLLHAAYPVRGSVAQLEPVGGDDPTPPISTTEAAPTTSPAVPVEGVRAAWNRWWSYAIVAAVAALAGLATWLNLRASRAKAGKRRRRR